MELASMLCLVENNSLIFVYYGDTVLKEHRDTYLGFYSKDVLNLDVKSVWVEEGYLHIGVDEK